MDNLCDSVSAVVGRTGIQLYVGRIHPLVSSPGADHSDHQSGHGTQDGLVGSSMDDKTALEWRG